MAVRIPIDETEGLYFITFTCCDWLPLFEIADGYDADINGLIISSRKTIL